jgi:hypothetical protein
LRRAVLRVDPDGAAQRHEQRRKARRVSYHGPTGWPNSSPTYPLTAPPPATNASTPWPAKHALPSSNAAWTSRKYTRAPEPVTARPEQPPAFQ